MRFPALLIFLLLTPALIALGHDVYLFYINHVTDPLLITGDLIKDKFKFSAFGFLWTKYEPESYKMAASTMAPENWALLDSFLTIKAFFAGLFFAGFVMAIMVVFAIFGVGPMAGEGGRVYGSGKGSGFNNIKTKSKKMDYKRK